MKARRSAPWRERMRERAADGPANARARERVGMRLAACACAIAMICGPLAARNEYNYLCMLMTASVFRY